jgi:flagellar biosynthesis GTPase FlhF
MFVLIAYIIHALFRKEGMMEYMDTSESESTENDLQEFTELVTDVVENHNDRLVVMEKELQRHAMLSGHGELMDDLNGQAGSEEEQQPSQTNMMQANPPAEAEAEARLAEKAAAEKAAAEKAAAEKAAAEKAAKEAAAKAAAAKLEVLKQNRDAAQKLLDKSSKKNRKDKRKKLYTATTAYNAALDEFKKMYPEYSQ